MLHSTILRWWNKVCCDKIILDDSILLFGKANDQYVPCHYNKRNPIKFYPTSPLSYAASTYLLFPQSSRNFLAPKPKTVTAFIYSFINFFEFFFFIFSTVIVMSSWKEIVQTKEIFWECEFCQCESLIYIYMQGYS